MIDGEQPALHYEGMSAIRPKLAEVGVDKFDHVTNIHIMQCLSSDYAVDKKILQYAPDLILTRIRGPGTSDVPGSEKYEEDS